MSSSLTEIVQNEPAVIGPLLFAVCAGLAILALVLAAIITRNTRRAEPFYKTFDAAPVGLVHVGMDSQWLRMNDKMLEITGYTREELVGKSFADITVEDDMAENQAQNKRLLSGEIDSYVLQKRYRRKDGRIIWVKISVNLVRNRSGEPDYYVSTVEDIDELIRAEHALQEQQARFEAFWNNSPFNQSLKDPQGRMVEVNRTYQETYGLPNDDVRGRSLSEAHGTEWGSEIDDFDREVLKTRSTRTTDITVPVKDRESLTIRVTKFPVYDREHHVVGVGGISFDITSQVRAAREMRESEERFRATFEQAAVGIAHVGLDGQWLRINQRYCDIVGYTEDELRAFSFREITHRDDLDADLAYRESLISGRIESYTREKRYLHKDGYPIWVAVTASLTQPSRDDEPYVIVVIEDISDRKKAEAALAAQLDQQSAIMAIGQLALTEQDVGTLLCKTADMVVDTLGIEACLVTRLVRAPAYLEVIAANQRWQKFVGEFTKPENSDQKQAFELISSKSFIFDNVESDLPDLHSPIIDEIGTISGASVMIAQADEILGALTAHSLTQRDFTSDDLTFLQSVANILATAIVRSQIADALSDRERTLNAVLDNAADGIVVADSLGLIIMVNDAAEEIFGYESDELLKMGLRDLVPVTYSGGGASSDSGLQFSAREMVGRRKDGSSVPIDVAMSEFEGPEGELHIALVRDITEQKSLQSQLVQASKLATVGEMAAGIAHELNQPLNIMRMAADNVLIRMEAGSADIDYARDNLSLISEQAGRMGKIILHMRVFSRQDTTDFVVFDPARAVRNACELMRRQLLLENITLNVDADVDDVMVHGIESQLEQVIINMITNARDAILENSATHDTGTSRGTIDVAISSGKTAPMFGVTVRDTGGGMPEEIVSKVFDPFFTTKEVGVGTGLGLSVSYGIISSMGGTITAKNEDGGCTMKVELPLAAEDQVEDTELSRQAPTLQ